ncbi:hypothetical protein HNQ36_001150 [Afipia massiliensis]|uniref:Uncharacterized protein n=1 Tax=Afipia massiliensis TaxID=211460 RepID=A0A840N383_9BRAD|nr:hypothetical protein [Afipia massiliensis]MBB5051196.1 hypothetical protein [Afipia massiliensis]
MSHLTNVIPQREITLLGTIGIFYRSAVASSLRRTILHLAQIRHRSEQPDTGDHKQDEKAEHHRIFDSSIAVVFGRFGSRHR